MGAWILGLLWSGCDTHEGVIGETREVIEAIEDGKSLKRIGKQAQDVVDAIQAERTKLDQRLDHAERLVTEARATLNQADEELAPKLDALDAQLKQLHERMADAGVAGDDVEALIQQVEGEIRGLVGGATHDDPAL